MKKTCWILTIIACCSMACNNNDDAAGKNPDTPGKTNDSLLAAADPDAALKKIKICTELLPPPPPTIHVPFTTDTIFNYDHERVDTLQSTTVRPTLGYLAQLKAYRWNTDTIHVAFLDGSPIVQQKVAAMARLWEDYAGIVFDFSSTSPRKDITISFLYAGSWSHYGTYSRKVRPSMNFGWLDETSSPEEYQRVVLHEFGHALGFVHEHLQPEADIPWNTDAVYRYYMAPPNNWDKETTDRNIFLKYKMSEINGTQYDSNSIMHYYIPSELTDGKYSVQEKNQLSESDKQFAAYCYPKKKKIIAQQ